MTPYARVRCSYTARRETSSVATPRTAVSSRACANTWQLPSCPDVTRILRIDAAFLRQQNVPGHLRRWMEGNWGSKDRFLSHGFGAVALHGDAVASWSLADCVVGNRAEIGIHTAPEHRRRGLASQVAGAAVTLAFDQGVTEVGWHCNDDNLGSYRTAESVGFTLQRLYHLFAFRPR
ncbi:GNAT family N-acetyltransferase [Actinopolymorpha singaporensis]